LSGKVLKQLDLLFTEWTDFLTVHNDRSNQTFIFHQRNGYKCADTAQFNGRNDFPIASRDVAFIRRQIGYVNHSVCV
jgi:hypothetical protein